MHYILSKKNFKNQTTNLPNYTEGNFISFVQNFSRLKIGKNNLDKIYQTLIFEIYLFLVLQHNVCKQ